MKFIADLHVHSKYSMATARNLDLENLYIWARKKGITVVGTGDSTHPAWFGEIKEKLIEETKGLYRLKPAIEKELDLQIPPSCPGEVRFLLSAEISSIYKKNGKTRKNHNLVMMPSLTSAEKFNRKLDSLGNIKSDGRPILGLDAHDLLEIALETDDKALFVPAHIWTPWFSLFGSKSGFDSIEECFEDLTPHIKVLETGLSSDPAMNWQISALDNMTLISNSDAHSPAKLGREANLFDCSLDFHSIKNAMATGDPKRFLGTLEFFPQEGKYHLDGHKKCGITCHPQESLKTDNLCPECGKPLTLGVLYRVMELADRPEGFRRKNNLPFKSLIPLTDILSEIYQVGPNTKTVGRAYEKIINELGPELTVLAETQIKTIEKVQIPLLGEAIHRIRKGEVHIESGYDGVFGKVVLFDKDERKQLMGQQKMFTAMPPKRAKRRKKKEDRRHPFLKKPATEKKEPSKATLKLNSDQQKAVEHGTDPLIIVAGPGTGKTMTITRRMVRLIQKEGVVPEKILAVTFTNKAAREMDQRIEKALGKKDSRPIIKTFHSLCLMLLTEEKGSAIQVLSDDERGQLIRMAIKMEAANGVETEHSPDQIETALMIAKQKRDSLETVKGAILGEAEKAILKSYQNLLKIEGVFDYEDLINEVVERLIQDKSYQKELQSRFHYLFVDEYQDINEAQYQLVLRLTTNKGQGLCVIGDPDQSVYGFRGSDDRFFRRFEDDFPQAQNIALKKSYRSTETIIKAAGQMLGNDRINSTLKAADAKIDALKRVGFFECQSDRKEAAEIARAVMLMVGGRGFHDIDTGWTAPEIEIGEKSYGDLAVLFRTRRQGYLMAEAMEKAGIPYQLADRKQQLENGGLKAFLATFKLALKQGHYLDLKTFCALEAKIPGKKSLEAFTLWGLKSKLKLQEALISVRQMNLPGVSVAQQRQLNTMAGKIIQLQSRLENRPPDKKTFQVVDIVKQNRELTLDLEQPIWQDLLNLAKQHSGDGTSFLAQLNLSDDLDTCRFNAQKVSLLTMHAAKGLEFPVVFIAGLEDGLVPFRSANPAHKTDLKEERRLFYVAMTRAKEALYFSWALQRQLFGKVEKRDPSPFLNAISDTLLARQKELVSPKSRKPKQMQFF